MRRLGRLVALVALLLVPPTAPLVAAGEPGLGCGSLAPFGTSCLSAPGEWPAQATIVVSTLGFVGTLTASVEWSTGRFTKVCDSTGLSYQYPVPLTNCRDSGNLPPPGTLVILRCRVAPHPTAPTAPPTGPWACKAE